MSISNIAQRITSILVSTGASTRELAPDKQVNPINRTANPSPVSIAESPEYGRSNLMAGNYADPNPEKSKYLQATMKSFETERTFKNKLDSIVTMLKVEFGDDRSSSGGMRAGLKAKNLLKRLQNDEVVEKSKEHLKNNRDELAEAVQGDHAVLAANGNPLADRPDMNPGSAPVSGTEAAPSPDAAAAAQASVDVIA